jgi:hypothetical protein
MSGRLPEDENKRLLDCNRQLVEEIRHLRCTMIEAGLVLGPGIDPILYRRLMGDREYFVDGRYNPYPNHDDLVSSQYLTAMIVMTEELEGYNNEFSPAFLSTHGLPKPQGG